MTSQRVTLLEHPRQSSWEHMNDVANTPLSSSLMSGYAAAVLEEEGHQVTVVEGNLGGLSPEQTVAAVERSGPDLLCVHAVYDWSDGAQLRSLVRAILDQVGPIPVLLYGFYATFAYEHLLPRFPGAVAAVLGEPEEGLREATAVLAYRPGSATEALTRVRGLAVCDGGAVRLTTPRPLIADLDTLPFPRRTPEMLSLREMNVAGSRGCYGSCTFCTINPFYGGRSRWRPREPERVADEIATLLDRHPDKDRFYFVDPNFFGPAPRGRERALTMARLLGERFRIRFGLEGRVNDIDEEVVEALVEAGFDEILIGLESGSDETLRRLNKRTSVEQNRRALRILRGHGVEPNVGFIMFEPESSLNDIRVNLAFLEEEQLLDRLAVTANVLYHQQILLAPTPAYKAARAGGALQVDPGNPYEGIVPYRHPEVAFLAETMAEVCRHLFAGLPRSVWLDEGRGLPPALQELNAFVVALFRRLLDEVDGGRPLPQPGAAAEAVDEGRAALSRALAELRPAAG